MSIRPDHGSNRNGNGKPDPTIRHFKATDAQSMAQKTSKPTHRVSPSEAVHSKIDGTIENESMTDRQRAVTGLDLTSPEDLRRLRDLLAPEYDTLAACRDQLLQSAHGQYVLIHGEEVRIHTDLDSAMEEAYTHYPYDLFFVGRIHERDFREYLATHGA